MSRGSIDGPMQPTRNGQFVGSNPTRGTDALKISDVSAAYTYASKLLAEFELKSPTFRRSIEGLPREVVFLLIGMAFIEGSSYGAQKLTERLKVKGAA